MTTLNSGGGKTLIQEDGLDLPHVRRLQVVELYRAQYRVQVLVDNSCILFVGSELSIGLDDLLHPSFQPLTHGDFWRRN